MGQVCSPDACAEQAGTTHVVAVGSPWRGPARHSESQIIQVEALSLEEAVRRTEVLEVELRVLKDDNYRIREEHLELERSIKDLQARRGGGGDDGGGGGGGVGGGGGGGDYGHLPSRPPHGGAGGGAAPAPATASFSSSILDPQVDVAQQVMYMQKLVRSLQEENWRLREAFAGGAGQGSGPAGGSVSEQEYRALQEQVARLQQRHLQQLQEARLLKASRSSPPPASGASTPVSTGTGAPSRPSPGRPSPGRPSPGALSSASGGSLGGSPGSGGQDCMALQAQHQALLREQEELRAKIRKLAAAS